MSEPQKHNKEFIDETRKALEENLKGMCNKKATVRKLIDLDKRSRVIITKEVKALRTKHKEIEKEVLGSIFKD